MKNQNIEKIKTDFIESFRASNNEAMMRRSLRERSYDPNGHRDSLIHGESGTVPRRMPRDFDPSSSGGRLLIGEGVAGHTTQNCHSTGNAGPRRWSEQQFARSASARLPRTRYPNDQRDENEYADRSPAQGSRDGERRIQQVRHYHSVVAINSDKIRINGVTFIFMLRSVKFRQSNTKLRKFELFALIIIIVMNC